MSRQEFFEKQGIRAIILVSTLDFGRCPIASRLPTALWPVAGKSVLERLLDHLADQGIKQVAICGKSASSLLDERYLTDAFELVSMNHAVGAQDVFVSCLQWD
jgi:NDP-sugar pyrophosphorylase family protein